MSGADGNPVVPVDVVQGIVQQFATVSQHTTTMVEVLAAASVGSGSPGVVDGGAVRTTDPAVRKVQEKDSEFPKYDGNPEHF